MKWNWSNLFGSGSVELPPPPMWKIAPIATVTHNAETTMRLVDGDKTQRVEVVLSGDTGSVTIGFNAEGLDNFVKGLIRMQKLLTASDTIEKPPS